MVWNMKKLVLGICLLICVLIIQGCETGGKELTFTGTVEAEERDIQAEIGGKILEIKANEGDVVRPGEIVAVLDTEALQYQVQQAKAAVKLAEAKLAELKAGSRSEQVEQVLAILQQAEALQDGAEKAWRHATETLSDVKRLYAQGAATEQQVKDLQAAADAAETQLNTAKKQYQAAKAQADLVLHGPTAEALLAAEANLEQARASLELISLQAQKGNVKADAGGTVLSRNFNPGEIAVPGSSILTTVDLQNLWVKIYVPEKQLGKVVLQQKVTLKSAALPNETITGEVVFISPEAEFTPKNIESKEEKENTVFAVKIRILDHLVFLKPGMTVDVTIGNGMLPARNEG